MIKSREVNWIQSQQSPGEIKNREVELDSQQSPGDIKGREVELDSQQSPGDIKGREVELASESQLDTLCFSCSSTVVLRTLSL